MSNSITSALTPLEESPQDGKHAKGRLNIVSVLRSPRTIEAPMA